VVLGKINNTYLKGRMFKPLFQSLWRDPLMLIKVSNLLGFSAHVCGCRKMSSITGSRGERRLLAAGSAAEK